MLYSFALNILLYHFLFNLFSDSNLSGQVFAGISGAIWVYSFGSAVAPVLGWNRYIRVLGKIGHVELAKIKQFNSNTFEC